MANVFKPKRSNVPSSVPTTVQLDDGELAVNSADKKIFLRDGASVVEVANFSTGGSGTEYWTQTDVGIHTLSNVGIGTTNPNTTLDVRGPITVGVGTVGVGSIFLTNEIDAWYYTGNSKSVTTDDGSPTAVYVGAAGTALFITGDNNNRVIQYTLSTPYDVSTAGAAVTFFSTSLQETTPAGIDFNSDGTKMFIVGQTAIAPLVANAEYVHEYSLSIPWNVSPSSVGWTTSYRINEDTSPNGVAFGDNGTKMYVIGNTNDRMYQYTLTTPYSLASGVSYSGNSLLVTITNAEGNFTDLSFNSDGSKVWVAGLDRDRIYEFTLATNWDISTGSYTNDFFTELDVNLSGLHVIPSQNVAYIVGTSLDTVYQFDTNNYSLKLCSDPSKNKINLGQSSSSIIFEGYARVKDNLHVRKGLYVGDTSRFASFADFSGTLNHSGSTATLNNNTAANTINLSTAAATSGVQKTINIGTGGAAGSRLLVTFGSATAGTISTVTFNPGTNLILGLTTTTAIPTGTASQPLQIGSASSIQGAYISGSVGIGITNPQGSLQVGTGVTVYGTTGIVSAVSFYGSGTNLSGIVTQIVAGSNVTISPIDGTGSVTINSTTVNRTIGVSIDGGGNVITTGTKGYVEVPYAGTIEEWKIIAEPSGSITFDIWKSNAAIPTNSNTITASAKPTLTTAQRATSTTLTGWTTAVSVNDVFGFEVESATTVTKAVLTVVIQQT